MAHGLINRGKDSTFASKKDLAWHRLGKVVDAMTSEEAMELGGLNFEVGLSPIYSIGQTIDTEHVLKFNNVIKNRTEQTTYFSKATLINGRFSTIRTDTYQPLGIVGSRYTPIQNREAFNFFDKVIGEEHTQYETVGALGNGEVVFITAKLPNYVKVDGENIDSYLLFTMAHDGSGAVQVMFTPIRVVCNNTLSFALKNYTNKVTIRHTKSAKEKINNLDRVMKMSNDNSIYVSEKFNRLRDTKIIMPDVEKLMMEVLGIKPMEDTGKLSTRSENILQNALDYYKFGFGQREIEGTAWGVLNGVTGYLQNVKNYRSDESAFSSMFIKNGISDASSIRQKTFNKLVELSSSKLFSI